MATPKIAQITTMEITGLKELVEMLDGTAPNEAKNLVRGATYGIGRRARDIMKRRVKKFSGDLEKSIYVVRRRGRGDMVIVDVRMRGTPHPHALMLEFGTRKTKPQPYIVPTVEELRGQVPAIFREEVGTRLAKNLAKKAKVA